MHNADILSLAGLRIDGRRCDEIRTMRHNIGFDKTLASDGSLYFEHGLNKVAVIVTGPQESAKRAELQNVEKGKVVCHINQFLSLSQGQGSGDKKKRRNRGDRKTTEMEKIVEQTFSSVVMLEYYIKSDINIEVSVMESDGSLICCIINAVCMALVHAGIMMNDLVVACSAGVTANKLVCADLSQLEENNCYMPVAIKSRTKEVIHMQLDARLSLDSLQETMDAALMGCDKILVYMDQHLRAMVLNSLERQ